MTIPPVPTPIEPEPEPNPPSPIPEPEPSSQSPFTAQRRSSLSLAHQVAGGQPACVLPVGLGEARVTGASTSTPFLQQFLTNAHPTILPPRPGGSEHYPSDGGAGTVRALTRSNRHYHLDNPPPLTVRLQPFGSDAHGHQTGSHRTPLERSPRSAESRKPRIGGSQLRVGHAARQRSDQGSSIARGRGPRVQVGPGG
jgi:hypothetical protein